MFGTRPRAPDEEVVRIVEGNLCLGGEEARLIARRGEDLEAVERVQDILSPAGFVWR